MGEKKNYVIAIIVEHKPGVLFKISNLFRRRCFNIESISAGTTKNKDFERITITLNGDDGLVEQVIKQLNKLVEVIKVSVLDPKNTVAREIALIKMSISTDQAQSKILSYTEIFKGRVVDVSHESVILEITGSTEKINAFIDLMKLLGIKEIARTGVTALLRGENSIRID